MAALLRYTLHGVLLAHGALESSKVLASFLDDLYYWCDGLNAPAMVFESQVTLQVTQQLNIFLGAWS
jgi:hypothetical protein